MGREQEQEQEQEQEEQDEIHQERCGDFYEAHSKMQSGLTFL